MNLPNLEIWTYLLIESFDNIHISVQFIVIDTKQIIQLKLVISLVQYMLPQFTFLHSSLSDLHQWSDEL